MSGTIDNAVKSVFAEGVSQVRNIKFFYDDGVTAEQIAHYLLEVRAQERNGLLTDVSEEVCN